MNIFGKDGWKSVLGMNARNFHIEAENSREAMRLVNSKLDAKEALGAAGVPVPPTILRVSDRRDLRDLDWDLLPDSWALKPN